MAIEGTGTGAVVQTTPANLPVLISYSGATNPPTKPGKYQVQAVVISNFYYGVAEATFYVEATNYTYNPYTHTPILTTKYPAWLSNSIKALTIANTKAAASVVTLSNAVTTYTALASNALSNVDMLTGYLGTYSNYVPPTPVAIVLNGVTHIVAPKSLRSWILNNYNAQAVIMRKAQATLALKQTQLAAAQDKSATLQAQLTTEETSLNPILPAIPQFIANPLPSN
jgi:hypothetical protein